MAKHCRKRLCLDIGSYTPYIWKTNPQSLAFLSIEECFAFISTENDSNWSTDDVGTDIVVKLVAKNNFQLSLSPLSSLSLGLFISLSLCLSVYVAYLHLLTLVLFETISVSLPGRTLLITKGSILSRCLSTCAKQLPCYASLWSTLPHADSPKPIQVFWKASGTMALPLSVCHVLLPH